jgi:hypothetical protein
VKEKAPPIFYPIPLSELPPERVGQDDGFYAPAYAPFSEEFNFTWTYITIGKAWGDVPPENVIAWLRFPGVEIEQGATVTSASIRLVSDGNYSVPSEYSEVFARIYAVDQDDVNAPNNKTELLAYPWTTAYTAWTIGTTTVNEFFNTPDISSVVQEVVNRPGWQSGNAIQFLINAPGTTGDANAREFYTIEEPTLEYQPIFSYTSI